MQRGAFLFGARRSTDWLVIIDGEEVSRHGNLANLVRFSPNGSRLAYVTYDAGKVRVVVDGVETGAVYDDVVKHSLTFTPDGGGVAYVARQADRTNYDRYFDCGAPVFEDQNTVSSVLFLGRSFLRAEVTIH